MPKLSKFIVDLTQGLKGPGSQHRDLALSQKVLSLLALQTVRVRDLLGKWAGGALCTPHPQGQSLPDRFEVVPSQAGFFLVGCSQPLGEAQRVNAREVFPRTREIGDPPRAPCRQEGVLGSQVAGLAMASSLSTGMALRSSAK